MKPNHTDVQKEKAGLILTQPAQAEEPKSIEATNPVVLKALTPSVSARPLHSALTGNSASVGCGHEADSGDDGGGGFGGVWEV